MSSNTMESSSLNSSTLVLRFSGKNGFNNGGATERLQGHITIARKLEIGVVKHYFFAIEYDLR